MNEIDTKNKLSILIPCYNEEKTIIKIIKQIKKQNYSVPYEIIIINDGSTDNTYNKLFYLQNKIKDLKIISYKQNQGKGYALQQGIKNVTGNITIIQDADLEYNPKQINELIEPILRNETNVVYGSRFTGTIINMSKTSIIGNIILTGLINLLFQTKLTDIETGYKIMKTKILRNLNLIQNDFEIEIEITTKLIKNKIFIKEIPINYQARLKNEKKINWKNGVKGIYYIIYYWLKL